MFARPTLSFVMPLHDEEEGIAELHRELQDFLRKLGLTIEVVFVDGGSRDRTAERLKELVAHDRRYRVITLARDFGKEAAMLAGIDAACGHAVVVMDADLQDPFEVVFEMVNLWKQGYDVVYGRRTSSENGAFTTRLANGISTRLVRWLIPTEETAQGLGDFRLISRRVVVALRQLRESHRLVRGLVSWVGFRQTEVVYTRTPRTTGKTKYPPIKRIADAFNAVTATSTVPLRVGTYLGLALSCFSLLVAAWSLTVKLFSSSPPPGWATLVVLTGLGFGTQLFMTGVLGEYLGKMYIEIKRRGPYILAESVNVEVDDREDEDVLPAELGRMNPLENVSSLSASMPVSDAVSDAVSDVDPGSLSTSMQDGQDRFRQAPPPPFAFPEARAGAAPKLPVPMFAAPPIALPPEHHGHLPSQVTGSAMAPAPVPVLTSSTSFTSQAHAEITQLQSPIRSQHAPNGSPSAPPALKSSQPRPPPSARPATLLGIPPMNAELARELKQNQALSKAPKSSRPAPMRTVTEPRSGALHAEHKPSSVPVATGSVPAPLRSLNIMRSQLESADLVEVEGQEPPSSQSVDFGGPIGISERSQLPTARPPGPRH
jgi:polyisoprenyl-phosphate glycosyltransferase